MKEVKISFLGALPTPCSKNSWMECAQVADGYSSDAGLKVSCRNICFTSHPFPMKRCHPFPSTCPYLPIISSEVNLVKLLLIKEENGKLISMWGMGETIHRGEICVGQLHIITIMS